MSDGLAGSRTLIVSPHSDDAAFSIGGVLLSLADGGACIEILTCFSVSAYTRALPHGRTDSVTRERKREDAQMVAKLPGSEVSITYLDLPDAPLRPGREVGTNRAGRLLPSEHGLATVIEAAIVSRASTDTQLLAPLVVGGHADHVLARRGAERAASTLGATLLLYEDQPYRALAPGENLPLPVGSAYPLRVSFPAERKAALLDCYPSQLTPDERAAILDYAAALSGPTGGAAEQLWRYDTTLARRVTGT